MAEKPFTNERFPPSQKLCQSPKRTSGSINSTRFMLTLSSILLIAPIGYGIWRLYANLNPKTRDAIIPEKTTELKINRSSAPGTAAKSYPKLYDVPNVPKGIFRHGGSTTFAPLRTLIKSQISSVFPGFELRYKEPPFGEKPGSGTGIAMLIEGQLSIAESSRALKDDEYKRAKLRGGLALEAVPVAIDGIGVFVTPQLYDQGINGLTLAQVRDIFTGTVQNWRNLGGPDQEIAVVSRDPSVGGTVDFFIENVLEKQKLGPNVQLVRDTTEAIRKVGSHKGSIGYASTSEAINQKLIRLIDIAPKENQNFVSPCENADCTAIATKAFADGSYPITRRLFVIIRRDGQLDEQAGIAYTNLLLSDDGQQLVQKAGLVPIR